MTETRLEPIWRPSDQWISETSLARYQAWLASTSGLEFDSYEALWRWSVTDLDAFWTSIVAFCGLQLSGDPTQVLAARAMPDARWFPSAEVSYPEHVFRGKRDEDVAILHTSEVRGQLGTWTWAELRRQTALVAAGLRSAGVSQGDTVGAYLPNIPETIAAFLACASLGAVWSAAAPEFGARAVIDRFAQLRPKVLLAADGYRYGGRDFSRTPVVKQISDALPSLEHVVRFGYLDGKGWDARFARTQSDLTFAQLPFDHPLWVLYTSGTTGLPKPVVHGHGGMLLEQLKTHNLHLDARAGDRIFWFSTTGWMMWNFLVGVLLTDAAIVLYDGNPAYPSLDRLWALASEARITTFGTSPAYIGSCIKAGIKPVAAGRELTQLRAVGATGSPLSPEAFSWIYRELPQKPWLFSTSGGTDVCTAFVGGVPTLPVYRGELQARALGAAVESWAPDGTPVVGDVGELVITQPMPSMPLYFWGDTDGARLHESYFSTYPGVWRHGDWIRITERGSAVIYGRSDSTINRGGVRMGTSEIYRAVLECDAVVDALIVDVPCEGTEAWMPLFVVLRQNELLDEKLVSEICQRIRRDCSPRHVPDEVRQIPEVPRTLSGKVLEIPVKRMLMGVPASEATSRDTLANPASLDYFVDLARRR